MIGNYMRQLQQELQLEDPFSPSKKGVYEYLLAEDLPIHISDLNPQGVLFQARLGPCPPNAGEAFYAQMLEGNLFGTLTYDATLGLGPDGKEMVLSKTVERKIDYASFRLMLDDFINTTLYWREQAGRK
jgi:hypothetical protein